MSSAFVGVRKMAILVRQLLASPSYMWRALNFAQLILVSSTGVIIGMVYSHSNETRIGQANHATPRVKDFRTNLVTNPKAEAEKLFALCLLNKDISIYFRQIDIKYATLYRDCLLELSFRGGFNTLPDEWRREAIIALQAFSDTALISLWEAHKINLLPQDISGEILQMLLCSSAPNIDIKYAQEWKSLAIAHVKSSTGKCFISASWLIFLAGGEPVNINLLNKLQLIDFNSNLQLQITKVFSDLNRGDGLWKRYASWLYGEAVRLHRHLNEIKLEAKDMRGVDSPLYSIIRNTSDSLPKVLAYLPPSTGSLWSEGVSDQLMRYISPATAEAALAEVASQKEACSSTIVDLLARYWINNSGSLGVALEKGKHLQGATRRQYIESAVRQAARWDGGIASSFVDQLSDVDKLYGVNGLVSGLNSNPEKEGWKVEQQRLKQKYSQE